MCGIGKSGRNCHPTAFGDGKCCFQSPHRSSHLDAVVDSTFGGFPYLIHHSVAGGIKTICSPELPREFQFLVGKIDGNNPAGSCNDGTQNSAEANTAEPDDGDALASPYFSGVNNGAHSGEHSAAKKCGNFEWNGWIDLNERVLGEHCVTGKGRYADVMVHGLPMEAETASTAQEFAASIGGISGLTQRWPAFRTRHAMTAGRHKNHHHVVTRMHIADVVTNLQNETCSFMTQHHRNRARSVAVYHREVRVAQPGCLYLNQNLARSRRRQIELLDMERSRLEVRCR